MVIISLRVTIHALLVTKRIEVLFDLVLVTTCLRSQGMGLVVIGSRHNGCVEPLLLVSRADWF